MQRHLASAFINSHN